MTERIRPNQLTPIKSELTINPSQNRLGREGNIFMAENTGDMLRSQGPKPQEQGFSSNPDLAKSQVSGRIDDVRKYLDVLAQKPAEGLPREVEAEVSRQAEERIDKIRNIHLRVALTNLRRRMEGAGGVSRMSDEDLKEEYHRLQATTRRIEGFIDDFGEKEKVAADSQPFFAQITAELQRRGIDTTALYRESLDRLSQRGENVRISLGAAEIVDPIGDNVLQGVVAEINQVIAEQARRQDRPDPILDRHFIAGQYERIQGLIDSGVNRDEALLLLTKLREWDREALQAQAEFQSRYFDPEQVKGIKTSEKEREQIFEGIFIGVDSKPGQEFHRALSLEKSGEYDAFMTLLDEVGLTSDESNEAIAGLGAGATQEEKDRKIDAETEKKREKLKREFSARFEIRAALHDANWSVAEGGGDIKAFAGAMSTFKSEYVDLIFKDRMVATALHMFEQAFMQIRAENNGQLPYQYIAWNYKLGSSELERRVGELMRAGMRSGIIEQADEWRLRRAIVLARGFGVASLRFPEIAAEARLPEETPEIDSEGKAKRIGSIYGESISRYLDPLEHIIEKFGVGEDQRAILYYFFTGEKKKGFNTKKDLKAALEQKSAVGSNKRLIDVINLFRVGTPFTTTSWRSFMTMEGMTPDKKARIGLGMKENRLNGDIEDRVKKELRNQIREKALREGRVVTEAKITEEANSEYDKFSNKEKTLSLKDFSKHPPEETTFNIGEYKRNTRELMWKEALDVNPMRVMWMIEKDHHGKRLELFQEVLATTGTGGRDIKDLLRETEMDLMLLQEDIYKHGVSGVDEHGITVVRNVLDVSHLDKIPAGERRDRVRAYVGKIRELALSNDLSTSKSFLEGIITEKADQKSPFPFQIGFEDAPFSDLDFINTGGRGFARRINDFVGAAQATEQLSGLINTIGPANGGQELVKALKEIKESIQGYDAGIAKEVAQQLAEGIISVYDQSYWTRIPVIGDIVGMASKTSFAQEHWGKQAMTWTSIDKRNFINLLVRNEVLTAKEAKKLYSDTHATKKLVAADAFKTYGQLVLFYMAFEFAKRIASDK